MVKINTRNKMYDTNSKIKKFLVEKGFENLYLFPHMRHIKDWIVDEIGFDAIGWKKGDKRIWLFQFKTNELCPPKIREKFKSLSEKYNCIPVWITVFDKRKLTPTHSEVIECYPKIE